MERQSPGRGPQSTIHYVSINPCFPRRSNSKSLQTPPAAARSSFLPEFCCAGIAFALLLLLLLLLLNLRYIYSTHLTSDVTPLDATNTTLFFWLYATAYTLTLTLRYADSTLRWLYATLTLRYVTLLDTICFWFYATLLQSPPLDASKITTLRFCLYATLYYAIIRYWTMILLFYSTQWYYTLFYPTLPFWHMHCYFASCIQFDTALWSYFQSCFSTRPWFMCCQEIEEERVLTARRRP
jgi:hypothetical protein